VELGSGSARGQVRLWGMPKGSGREWSWGILQVESSKRSPCSKAGSSYGQQ
jgi:hypothetical protein